MFTYVACQPMELKCDVAMAPSMNNCIASNESCDDMNDCPMGEDEEDMMCDGRSIASGPFKKRVEVRKLK